MNISKIYYCIWLSIMTLYALAIANPKSWDITTEDCIFNPSFEILDQFDSPLDWDIKDPEVTGVHVIADKNTRRDGDVSVKMYVGHDGVLKPVFMSQRLLFDLRQTEEFYVWTWVKTATVDSTFNFQLAVQQGLILPGRPWYISKRWSVITSVSNANDWEPVETVIETHPDANKFELVFKFDENTMPGCTAWVDGIEIFADIAKGPSLETNTHSLSTIDNNISFNGTIVTFSRPTNYHLRIFSTNGKLLRGQSGYDKMTNRFNHRLAPGCYVLGVESGLGTSVRHFIVPTK